MKNQYQDLTIDTIVSFYNDNKRKINEIYSKLNELDNKIERLSKNKETRYIVGNTINKKKRKFKKIEERYEKNSSI